MKKKEICTVIRQKEIGDGIFSMWIQTENIGKEAKPGQFVSLYSKDGSKLLPSMRFTFRSSRISMRSNWLTAVRR